LQTIAFHVITGRRLALECHQKVALSKWAMTAFSAPIAEASTGPRVGGHSAPYGSGFEAKSVRDEIGTFDYASAPAYRAVRQCFGDTLRLKELKAIVYAVVFSLKQWQGAALPKMSRNIRPLPGQ
jgi:hypothetical protein